MGNEEKNREKRIKKLWNFQKLTLYNKTCRAATLQEMEYGELANAKSMEEWEENLYHLSVACLHAWRIYNHKI